MSALTLTNKERTYCVRNFYSKHHLIHGSVTGTKDISTLSFPRFCKLLGDALTPDQINISKLILKSHIPIVAVVSSHGVGKSHLASILGLYTVIVQKGLVIVTSPTARQVREIIFSSIQDNYRKLIKNKTLRREFGIDLRKQYVLGQTFIREVDDLKEEAEDRFWFEELAIETEDDFTEEHYEGLGYAFGFSSRDTDANATQGIHADKMLVIGDEACGLSETVMDGLMAIATGSNNKILLIGNPVAKGNRFEEISRKGHYKMTGFNHPNCKPYYSLVNGKWTLTDKSCLDPTWKPKIEGAVTPKWIEQARERYGEDSLFWQTRVLAKFPTVGMMAGQLVHHHHLAKGHEYHQLDQSLSDELAYTPLLVGVDVGDDGDPTVITIAQFFKDRTQSVNMRNPRRRHTLWVRGIFEIETDNSDFMQQERNKNEVIRIVDDFIRGTNLGDNNVVVALDGTGIGVSLAKDLTKETRYKIIPVHFNATAALPRVFENARAEIYWWLKFVYERGVIKMSESVLDSAKEQLGYEISGTRYEIDPKTERIRIIPKDDIRKILGCSPNYGDSGALLCRALYEHFPDLFEAVK